MPLARRHAQPGILLLALMSLGFVGACHQGLPVPGGDVAASLVIAKSSAPPFDPAALRGKPSLVVFASPTCPHCLAELPIAQRVASAAGAGLVAVFLVGTMDKATAVAKATQVTGSVLLDDAGALRKQYDIKAVPYTLVLGPDGHARRAFRGEQTEATLRDALVSAR